MTHLEIIDRWIDQNDMTYQQFDEALDRKKSYTSKLLRGEVKLTARMAVVIEQVTGIDAAVLMRLAITERVELERERMRVRL